MGIGRFAFTPLFPLMVRDLHLSPSRGAWLAAFNYFGYWLGLMLAARLAWPPHRYLAVGLLGTTILTILMGLVDAWPVWLILRLCAGAASAAVFVGMAGWSLAWLVQHDRPALSGVVFAGVGVGIMLAGLYSLGASAWGQGAAHQWVQLGLLAAVLSGIVAAISRCFPAAVPPKRVTAGPHAAQTGAAAQAFAAVPSLQRLFFCYAASGFGYILPATYLPLMARQWVDDPMVFGRAWPVFGLGAALSTWLVGRWMMRSARLRIWARWHLTMALGVLLPVLWPSLGSIVFAAALVGGSFMVTTLIATHEARVRLPAHAAYSVARVGSGFALGQVLGPVVTALLHLGPWPESAALNLGLSLAAAGLALSAVVLWRPDPP
jgi:MFS family permease